VIFDHHDLKAVIEGEGLGIEDGGAGGSRGDEGREQEREHGDAGRTDTDRDHGFNAPFFSPPGA
jgi:hypothetical protein